MSREPGGNRCKLLQEQELNILSKLDQTLSSIDLPPILLLAVMRLVFEVQS